jgi:hypothetical protein
MNTEPTDDLVSIVGSSYFQPIAELFSRLRQRLPEGGTNSVKTSPAENGYAASICLLSVVCFESYLMRVRYKNRQHPSAKEKNALKFIEKLYPQFPYLERITEAFILRDVLAHNHLWELDVSWDDELGMLLHSARKDKISGDNKYNGYVDMQTRTTRKLGLNVVPIRVNRTDASKVLSTVWDGLLFFERQNRDQCSVSHLGVWPEGRRMEFREFVSLMNDGELR